MKTWILVIHMGITGWGSGGRDYAEFKGEESCYRALEAMRITQPNRMSGEDDEQTLAYCKPKK